ncbi:COG3650 family protein [Pseudomonas zhanjiangensis]|uniref:COG3650 family protein n=1 Tax=Pseudomonas zhanjiangensis TaxID=3239015 RepID=A0ABV3YTK2_9PSED
MHASRRILFVLLPLLASCQTFDQQSTTAPGERVRLQGEITRAAGHLLFSPCQEQRRFIVSNDGATDVIRDSAALLAEGPGPLFADLRGRLAASPQSSVDGQLALDQVYRLQREGQGCADLNFTRTLLHADGHEPDWNLTVGVAGLVLKRPGQPPLALPYLEERLPEGRLNLTSEANGQRLELWVAPQHCIDSMSGGVRHLAAELRLNGEVMRGCGYLGGARND